jgi:hypothetical protein
MHPFLALLILMAAMSPAPLPGGDQANEPVTAIESCSRPTQR